MSRLLNDLIVQDWLDLSAFGYKTTRGHCYVNYIGSQETELCGHSIFPSCQINFRQMQVSSL